MTARKQNPDGTWVPAFDTPEADYIRRLQAAGGDRTHVDEILYWQDLTRRQAEASRRPKSRKPLPAVLIRPEDGDF